MQRSIKIFLTSLLIFFVCCIEPSTPISTTQQFIKDIKNNNFIKAFENWDFENPPSFYKGSRIGEMKRFKNLALIWEKEGRPFIGNVKTEKNESTVEIWWGSKKTPNTFPREKMIPLLLRHSTKKGWKIVAVIPKL